MYILGSNSAGLLNKSESFQRTIDKFNCGVFFVQETKVRRKNQIKIKDYIMFEHMRKDKGGGGLLTAVHKSLKPVSISEEDETEVLVVQGNIENLKIRFINGYGPQEKETDEVKAKFFNRIDLEVKSCKMSGALVCMEMDANSKLGSQVIAGDPENEQSKNGKLLMKVVEENDLVVVNGTDLCEGTITRYRKTINGEEKAVIDFFIVCRNFLKLIIKMEVDDKRVHTLTKFSNKRGDKNIKKSDHNILSLLINSNWTTLLKDGADRIEIYNYKNKEDFERFKEETEHNLDLKNCFEETNEDLNVSADRWLSIVNRLIQKSFKKIRINGNKRNKDLSELFEKKEALENEILQNDEYVDKKEELENDLEEVLDEIAAECGQENRDIANNYLGKMNDPLTGFNIVNTWGLKKKLAPKNTIDPPMAKKDAHGHLVTEKEELEKLYLETYVERLKPNKMADGLELLEEMKEYLYQLRYDVCIDKKSKDWSGEELEKALKGMKNNKARDAHGHVYELFKYGGSDLKNSMLKLFNLVKDKQIYPKIVQPSNITTLYKKKGVKSDMNSERGVFNLVKIRSIQDRLIYNRKYSEIESSMSCSNIGARKERNIRDHLLVLNSILLEESENKNNKLGLSWAKLSARFDS